MKVGISLSGGGIKGAAHIGFLQALKENNINIDAVSGASSGSIIATLLAVGYQPLEMLVLYKKFSKNITYFSFNNLFKLIKGLISSRKITIKGFNDGKLIENTIYRICKNKGFVSIEDVKMPLIISAVNLMNGELLLFSSVKNEIRGYSDKTVYNYKANLAQCVRASISFPGVFEPYNLNGCKLIDGGVRENTPWKELKKIGIDKIICIVFSDNNNMKSDNFIEIIDKSFSIMKHELENYELYKAPFVISIKTSRISLLDTSKIDELYKIGYEEGIKNILRIKKYIGLK